MRGKRLLVGFLLVVAMFFNTVGTLFAGTTGTINGTVTDSATGATISGVVINAVAPTARYTATTDARGFFSLTGVSPDTYTVSFEQKGFQPDSISGISVFADGVANVSDKLGKSLTTIGRVSARSQGGAFQPSQPLDTYTVTTSQINNVLGQQGNTSESQLLASLPGASYDSSGYPVLRGGRENEEGFQFEGIDYTEPFTHQFVNALTLNGVAALQLTPGAGDASSGNTGTGIINLISKRGTNPAFGSIQLETGTERYYHQLQAEYGFASPDGRFSNYVSFVGRRQGFQYGPQGTPAADVGEFFGGRSYDFANDLLDNFIFKFGKNNSQSLQLFYETSDLNAFLNYGGIDGLNYKSNDPRFLRFARQLTGLSTAQIQSVIPLSQHQSSITQALDRTSADYEPNNTFKIQYSNNLDSNTFLTTKFYKVNSVVNFDQPYQSASPFSGDFFSPQGGLRTGVDLNITHQFGSKHLVQAGGKYEFDTPVLAQFDPIAGFYDVAGFANQAEIFDFVTTGACPANQNCGFLSKYFPTGQVPSIPAGIQSATTTLQQFSGYITDTFTPTNRLKIQAGFRIDGANFAFPNPNNGLYHGNVFDKNGNCVVNNPADPTSDCKYNLDTAASRPRVPEPRLAFSYQVTKNDAIRASYGRSVQFPPIGSVDLYGPQSYFDKYKNIPSYNNQLGAFDPANPGATAATTCGLNFNRLCRNYAEQLYFENANGFLANGYQPAKPETFNNYDASVSHQFGGGVAVKLTGFFTRGYDALVQTSSPKTDSTGKAILDPVSGVPLFTPPVTTNLGQQRTTGLEFLLTRDVPYGIGGTISATYINEFASVLPGSSSEDFFPSIPPASLVLGNSYRVGFLTPFVATASLSYKSKGGFRFVPYVQYTRGYPIGQGILTPTYINGVAQNVPNTNITNSGQLGGAGSAPAFVDPANPGTLTNPVVVASRNTPESSAPGGRLSSPQIDTQFTFEYAKPGSRSTIGVQIFNPFNNNYLTNIPTYNGRYQPVANGISGPLTGTITQAYTQPPQFGYANYGSSRYGQNAYTINPSSQPFTAHFYYRLAL